MADEPPLVQHYLEFCKYRRDAGKDSVDLGDVEWLYPSTLLLLADFIASKGPKFKYEPPSNRNVRNYLSIITGQPPHNKTDSFIPIIRASRLDNSYIEQIYQLVCEDQSQATMLALKYVIGELVDNIDQHSKCNASSFMVQSYKKRGFLEGAFFDNGVTIPGSFREAKMYRKGMSDADCIKEAITGTSTKLEGGRGHGLPSTIKILKAMNSDIFIVSGKGAAYLNGTNIYLKDDISYNLDDFSYLDGTFISFQIHLPIRHIDIYNGGYL